MKSKTAKFCIFFFKQKTAYEIGTGDWSSDVCSSDLARVNLSRKRVAISAVPGLDPAPWITALTDIGFERSEERRVGKECRSRWSPYH